MLPDKNANYKDVEYWNKRFTEEDTYEWCKGYTEFKTYFNSNVYDKNSQILVLGCGNSNLSLDLFNDGYTNITNIDYSGIIVNKMKEKYGHLMSYVQMDMRSLVFPDPTKFDVVIEKGTLDVLFTGEKSVWTLSENTQMDVHNTLSSILKVLKPQSGIFISVTFAEPYFRKKIYSKYWNTISVESFGDFFHYYFYSCKNLNN